MTWEQMTLAETRETDQIVLIHELRVDYTVFGEPYTQDIVPNTDSPLALIVPKGWTIVQAVNRAITVTCSEGHGVYCHAVVREFAEDIDICNFVHETIESYRQRRDHAPRCLVRWYSDAEIGMKLALRGQI